MGKAKVLIFNQCDRSGKVAAIYVRCSHEDLKKVKVAEREEHRKASIQTQTLSGIEEAKRQGWPYQIYEETNVSGTDRNRPELNRMLSDIKAQKIHTVISRDPSRISRNTGLSVEILDEYCYPYGVDIICWLRPCDIKTDQGRTMFEMAAVMDSSYVRQMRVLSMQNRRHMAEQGKLANNARCYGYEPGPNQVPVIVEHEKEMVLKIFKWFLEGKSLSWVCQRIMEQGYKTKKGGKWCFSTMADIIRNPRYMGKIRYAGKLCPSPFPPIISEETWNQANQRLAELNYKLKVTKKPRLLTGLLTCGYCLESRKTNPYVLPNMCIITCRHKDKKVYDYYGCQTSRNTDVPEKLHCDNIQLRMSTVEELIVSLFDELIANLHTSNLPPEAILQTPDRSEAELKLREIDDKITKVTEHQRRITLQIANPSFDVNMLSTLSGVIDSLAKQLSTLQKQKEALLKEAEDNQGQTFVQALKQYTTDWKNLAEDQKNFLLQQLIEMIVFKRCIVVKLKIKPRPGVWYSPLVIPIVPRKQIGIRQVGYIRFRFVMPNEPEYLASLIAASQATPELSRVITADDFHGDKLTWAEHLAQLVKAESQRIKPDIG